MRKSQLEAKKKLENVCWDIYDWLVLPDPGVE